MHDKREHHQQAQHQRQRGHQQTINSRGGGLSDGWAGVCQGWLQLYRSRARHRRATLQATKKKTTFVFLGFSPKNPLIGAVEPLMLSQPSQRPSKKLRQSDG